MEFEEFKENLTSLSESKDEEIVKLTKLLMFLAGSQAAVVGALQGATVKCECGECGEDIEKEEMH